MNQLEYIPGIGGQSVQMDGPTSFVGIAENLRSREWEYDLGFRDLVSATRPAREVDVNFYADYATADDLRRVSDADVTARTPGIFIAQKEWRQRGYILASKPSDIQFGRLSTELKVALLDGAWWRLVEKSFKPDITSTNLFGTALPGYITGSATTFIMLNNSTTNGTVFVAQVEQNTDYTLYAEPFTGSNRRRLVLLSSDPRDYEQHAVGTFEQLTNEQTFSDAWTYTFNSGSYTWVLLGTSTSSTAYNPSAFAMLVEGTELSFLDYPHDYEYDYQKASSTEDVTPSVLTPSDVRLVIYGPAVNPYVIVGGNRYQVNVTVPSGGYLVVDGRDKTINMTLADGTVQNVFSSGVRGGGSGGGTYIFEKIPAGTSEVTYDGSFGFDLGWYEEEGEPPWSQS